MKTVKIAACAFLLSVSFVLSLVEGLVPIGAIIPLPGLKLGLANVAVMVAFVCLGRGYALLITLTRPVLSLLLFGNVTSALLSLSGGVFAFVSVVFSSKLLGKKLSFCGISALSAFCHSMGQIIMASLVLSGTEVFFYFPILALTSTIMGFFTGELMNLLIPRIDFAAVFRKEP